MSNRPHITAFYFPNWHVDQRNQLHHGQGWTEWELLQAARPRYPGHNQPVVPAWGYFDEADPAWAARQIDLAADHGIDSFLFDWYYYNDGDFLSRALDEGFLAAPNRARMQFALMWANHDWHNIHPARFTNQVELLQGGAVNEAGFDRLIDTVIERYFSQPNYLRLDGKPFFSVYEIGTLIKSFGGVIQAAKAMQKFRDKSSAAGCGGVHFNAIVWQLSILASEVQLPKSNQLLEQLGFDSATSYVWVHHSNPAAEGFPKGSYLRSMRDNIAVWHEYAQSLQIPYGPNVTMGWDPSPRTLPTDRYEDRGYPFTGILDGNTPAAFAQALRHAQAHLRNTPKALNLLTLNAWNEWTEGSYLLPDTKNGTGYVEAIREVFGVAGPSGK